MKKNVSSEQKPSSVRLFKKNSVFFSTFLLLLVLLFALIAFFGYYMNSLLLRNQREYSNKTEFSLLLQTSEAMNLTVGFLREDMERLVWNEIIVRYLVDPFSNDETIGYELLSLLENTSNRSSLVQNVWLYSPYAQVVFSSEGKKQSLEEFPEASVIRSRGLQLPAEASEDLPESEIICIEDRLFFVQDLRLANVIGTLYFEISGSQLYSSLGVSGGGTYLFNGNGELIVGSTLACPFGTSVDLEKSEVYLMSADTPEDSSMEYYRVDNAVTGWSLLRVIDRQSQSLSTNQLLTMLLPGMLIFLGIGSGGSYLVTRRMYQPINRLIYLVLQAAKTGDKSLVKNAKNELDYLELSYFRTLGENLQMMEAQGLLADEVLEQIYRNILIGKEMTTKYLEDVLDGIGELVHLEDRYVVLVCRKKPEESYNSGLVDANLFFLSIQKILGRGEFDCRVTAVQMENDITAIVLCFQADSSVLAIKREGNGIEELIRQAFAPTAYAVQLAGGNIYPHMKDLIYSYREALQEVNYAMYMNEGQRDNEPVPDSEEQARRNYYAQRVRQMMDAASNGDTEEARQILKRTLAELTSEQMTFTQIQECGGQIVDLLMERLISYPLDFDTEGREQIYVDVSACTDKEGLEECIRSVSGKAIESIKAFSRKSCYRHVEAAKQYMQQNFAQASLGVGDVSAYLGIHASYFSELFNEVVQESFTSYLNRIRVEHAKNMLAMTQIPIKDVGFKCGFNTVQNFNRVFKKYVKMTPSQFRETIPAGRSVQ